MESRRLVFYLVVLLVILTGMLAYLVFQMRAISREAQESLDPRGGGPDFANGGAIYEKGTDLSGRMIPVSGGPDWYATEGGGCAVCHGHDGRGGRGGEKVRGLAVTPPDIRRSVDGPVMDMSVETFTGLVKWGERPGGRALSNEMPRFDVPERDMADLMAYIRRL